MAYINLGQVLYPVGAVYQSWSSVSPSSLFGGVWSQITEKFLYCANSAGGTGGASTVALTIDQMPQHGHSSPSAYFIVQSNNGSMRTTNPFVTGAPAGDNGTWRARLAEDSHQNPLPTGNAGGGASHENMPPYIKCYAWRRIS